jgi:hypothetical protein
MSVYPSVKHGDEASRKKELTEKITRILALVLAGTSVFFFFFKLLFF